MNKKQKIVLWIGIIIIVLMGLFPPWLYITSTPSPYLAAQRCAGYHFILTPPGSKLLFSFDPTNVGAREYFVDGYHLHISLLCIQWIMVSFIIVGFLVTFKNPLLPKP